MGVIEIYKEEDLTCENYGSGLLHIIYGPEFFCGI